MRAKRFGAGFRILGEGQLSLTKFLILTDKPQDLRDFKTLFEHILERVDWESDFFIFDRTSFDTLDYASGKINHGSKAMLVGVGDKKRELKREFQRRACRSASKRRKFSAAAVWSSKARTTKTMKRLAERIAKSGKFDDFEIVVMHDNDRILPIRPTNFYGRRGRALILRPIFTPKKSKSKTITFHYTAPIVIDARMKPWYPKEVEAREDIVKLVDRRWREYFPK